MANFTWKTFLLVFLSFDDVMRRWFRIIGEFVVISLGSPCDESIISHFLNNSVSVSNQHVLLSRYSILLYLITSSIYLKFVFSICRRELLSINWNQIDLFVVFSVMSRETSTFFRVCALFTRQWSTVRHQISHLRNKSMEVIVIEIILLRRMFA